jgi:hypothetical protein
LSKMRFFQCLLPSPKPVYPSICWTYTAPFLNAHVMPSLPSPPPFVRFMTGADFTFYRYRYSTSPLYW